MHSRILGATPRALTLATLLAAPPATAQVATALLVEDGPIPGAPMGVTADAVNNTAVNHVGGYAVSVSSSDDVSRIWGNATGGAGAVLRAESTIGDLEQVSFESFLGLADSGAVCYSANTTRLSDMTTGLDGVWVDDTVVMNEEQPVTSLPGQFWSFGSRPGITADGTPYWVGGVTTMQGGGTQNRGVFIGFDQTPVVLATQALPNLPVPLSSGSGVDFDFRFSADGSQYILAVDLATMGGASDDGAMVLNGEGLLIDGALVQESMPLPAAAGGLPGENWDNFDFDGVNNAGDWFFTGDSDADTSMDEIIVQNGMVTYREGDTVDGFVLSGSIEGAFQNENSDLAFIWDVDDPMLGNVEALYLNGMLLLKEGDEVDLDGDLMPDAGAVVSAFTGISSLTLGDRAPDGTVQVYFTADVDTMGTSTTTDDVEGFFCLTVQLPECFLVIGPGPGTTAFNPAGGHTFYPQVADVDEFQPVLLEDLGEIPLPLQRPTAAFAGGTLLQNFAEPALVSLFSAQVLMYNPRQFPTNPEQFTQPILVYVFSNGHVHTRPYGSGTGMSVWVERGLSANGEPVLRFPFSIPGF